MSDFRGALGGAEIAREESTCEYALPPKMLVISALTSKQITIILLIVIAVGAQIFELAGGGELIDKIGQTVGRLTVPALIASVAFLTVVGFAIALASPSRRHGGSRHAESPTASRRRPACSSAG